MDYISPSDPFSVEELRFLQNLEREFRMKLDYDEIARHLLDFTLDDYRIGGLPEIVELPPPRRAAAYVALERRIKRDFVQESGDLSSDHLLDLAISLFAVHKGKELIDDLETWWTHEPTFEILFEMGQEELRIIKSVMLEFFASDHFLAFMQYRMRFLSSFDEWDATDLKTGNIRNGLDAYQEATNVFEIGFPLLLVVKRALDGNEPSIDSLVRSRMSTVIRELTDTEENENSVYFDLMVNQYDAALRNALAHGDVVIDSVDSEIKIPTRDSKISYEQSYKTATRNISSALFLTEVLPGTIKLLLALDRDSLEDFRTIIGD